MTSGPAARPIRVLHILDCLRAGGLERAVWDLVRLGDRSRVTPRVVTACAESAGDEMASAFRDAGFYAPAVRRLDGGPWTERLLDAMPRFAKDRVWSLLGPYDASERCAQACGRIGAEYLRFRPDVIHAHGLYGMRLGAWLKSWTGKPLVYSVWNRIDQLVADGAEWVVADYATLHPWVDAFSTEHTYRPELLAQGIPNTKIHDLVGCVDFAAIDRVLVDAAAHHSAVRRRLGIPPQSPIALSTGRLTPTKGHRHALEAVAIARQSIPQLHWIVVGDGEERTTLIERARALDVEGVMHLVGYVAEPLPYYAAADVFLRTFELEGDTRSSLDAMAFALPVIGFETGVLFDRIPHVGHGVRVAVGNVTALAAAMVEILGRPDRGRGLGVMGAADVRRHFGVDVALNMFSNLYATVRRDQPAHDLERAA